MTLMQQSLSGGMMIMAIVVIRALCIHHLPKRLMMAFWSLPLIRLLIPYTLPFSGSVYTLMARQPSAAYQPIQTAAAPLTFTAIPAAGQAAAPAEALSGSWWSVLYLIGLTAFAVYFLTAYVRSLREFRTALPVRNTRAQQFLHAQPLRRRTAIRQSDRITAPLSYGVFRPVILLPSGTDWTDEASLRYVLTHEMTHIRRLDAVTKLILTMALCVHWFNPLVWVMNILANRDVELACDADVLRQLGWQSRSNYALTLISMEERKSSLTPLSSSFSKNAIEERIIAMMKFKRTSVTALTIALIMMLGVSAAFATTAAPDTQAKPHSFSTSKLSGDAPVASASSAPDSWLAQWESSLAPYLPFGLTYAYDSAADSVRMFYQGVEICGLWDEVRQIWITDHAGNGHGIHGKSAPELYAVYTDGHLTGLRFASEEEQAEWTALREQSTAAGTISQETLEGWQKDEADQLSPEEMMELYGAYGISYDAQGNLLYKGEKVRYFCDGVGTEDGEWFIRHDSFNKEGTVDVYTQRACLDNGDGSVNPFGPLVGLRSVTYEEEEFHHLQILTAMEEDVVETVAADVIADKAGGYGETLADRFSRYAEYGVVFDGKGQGSISYQGEAVGKFIDIQPEGGVFTYTAPDGGGLSVCTVYDSKGVLTGVEVFE